MKKSSKKNYIILIVLLFVTFLLTIMISKIYLNRSREESEFYVQSNKINAEEIDQIALENPDIIYYISDKYDLSYKDFELSFKQKLEEKNLLSKLVYVDMKKSVIKKIKKDYKLNINIYDYPIIIFVADKKVIKTIYVSQNKDIDNYIDYGVFE